MFTRRSPKVIREATRLRAIRGAPFVEAGGKQYAELGEVATPDEAGDADAVLRVPQYAEADGQRIEVGARYRVLEALPPGRYEQLRAERHTRSAPLRPVDALASCQLLAPRPGLIASQPGAPAPGVNLGRGGFAPGRPAARGRDAILARIEATGTQLVLANGRHLALAPGGRLRGDVRELLEVPGVGRLLVGWLSGHPVGCELDHGKDAPPPAVTIALGGLAICEAHASGEVAP